MVWLEFHTFRVVCEIVAIAFAVAIIGSKLFRATKRRK